jgi:hypothetical protein
MRPSVVRSTRRDREAPAEGDGLVLTAAFATVFFFPGARGRRRAARPVAAVAFFVLAELDGLARFAVREAGRRAAFRVGFFDL